MSARTGKAGGLARLALALALILGGWGEAWAAPATPPSDPVLRSCFDLAARAFSHPVEVLWAIAWKESRYRQKAINRNTNGTRDVGVMQINESWRPVLEARGIPWPWVEHSACINILVGAWLLRKKHDAGDGSYTDAVARYHSRTHQRGRRYAESVGAIMLEMAGAREGLPQELRDGGTRRRISTRAGVFPAASPHTSQPQRGNLGRIQVR